MRVAIARLLNAFKKHLIKVVLSSVRRGDAVTLKQHAGLAGAHSAWTALKKQSGIVPLTKKVAQTTAKSVTAQLSEAIDTGDDWDPDLEAEAIDYSDRVVGGLEDKSALAIERAQDILDEWDGDDPDDLEAQLDDGLDGIIGGGIAWAALAFGDMFANMNQSAQTDAGVAKYTWLSQNDSHVRPEHAALDGLVASWDDPPLTAAESDNGEDDHAGEDYNCVVGAQPVSFHAPTTKAWRRPYRGDVTTLVVAPGRSVVATRNHPVLTRRGWLAAHLVEVGDYLVEIAGEHFKATVDNPEGSDATAEEVFGALSLTGKLHRVHGRAGWFHGDVTDEQVDVVDVDRGLRSEAEPAPCQLLSDEQLAGADSLAPGRGHLEGRAYASWFSPDSVMGGAGPRKPLLDSGVSHPLIHGVAATTTNNAALTEDASNCEPTLAEAHSFGDGKFAHPAHVKGGDFLLGEDESRPSSQRDAIGLKPLANALRVDAGNLSDTALVDAIGVHPECFVFHRVERRETAKFDGFVYNFETATGWFCAHGLIIHNCRCVASPADDDEELTAY